MKGMIKNKIKIASLNFDVFDGVQIRKSEEKVRLYKSGLFWFNSWFIRNHNLQGNTHVILLHIMDANNSHVIGLKFTRKAEFNSRKLTKFGNRKQSVIYGFTFFNKSFLIKYGIKIDGNKIELIFSRQKHPTHGDIFVAKIG